MKEPPCTVTPCQKHSMSEAVSGGPVPLACNVVAASTRLEVCTVAAWLEIAGDAILAPHVCVYCRRKQYWRSSSSRPQQVGSD